MPHMLSLRLFRALAIGLAVLPGLSSAHTAAARLPVDYPAISFVSARLGWVLATRGQAGTVLRTSDGGRSWVRLSHPSLPFNMPSLQFVDARHGWLTSLSPVSCGGYKAPPCRTIVLRTADGGRHWTRLGAPVTAGNAVSFIDPYHGWLMSSRLSCPRICTERLYATADGGTTWRPLATAPRLPLMTMSWVDQRHGWVAGGDLVTCRSAIYATADGGRTWTRQLAPGGLPGLLQVGMLDAQRGWAVGGRCPGRCSMGGCDDYTLYRTVDGGTRWTREHSSRQAWWNVTRTYGGFPGPPRFVTARDGWIPFSPGAGPGAGGLAITADGGSTWRRVLGAYSLDIDPLNARDGWAVGLSRMCPSSACNADLLHTTDGGRTWSRLHPMP
jgi:photosystem II stability/assembly factor-like uncharacterized protein